jgi:transposase-like protein
LASSGWWPEKQGGCNPLAIFEWRQKAPELIFGAARRYRRYSLSLRDVEELLTERGLDGQM